MIFGLSCAELTKVLSRSWHFVREELHLDTAKWLSAERDVEETNWICLSGLLRSHLDDFELARAVERMI